MSRIVEKYLEYIVAVVIGVITRNMFGLVTSSNPLQR